MLTSNKEKILMKKSFPVILTLVILSLGVFIGAPSKLAQAANCDGLPSNMTSGTIPAGTYTLTDNCAIDGTFTINSGTVTINGGGFAIDGGGSYQIFDVDSGTTLELNNVTLHNANYSTGGAIINAGTTTISNSVVRNNNSNFGGVVHNYGASTVNMINSVFSSNTASDGGVIYNYGTINITNSTFSGNYAPEGGVIYNYSTINITNSTLSENSASDGGAIYNNPNGTINLLNTIISNNPSSVGNCRNFDTINDNGGNLEDTNTCGLSSGANTNPLLDTFTGSYYPLQAGSPAIDAIPTCAVTTDQIGTSRPQGSACDIGAIEMLQSPNGSVSVPPAPAPPTCNLIADVVAPDLPDGVYCRVLMRDGAWVANPGSVPAPLANENTMLAVDVFRVTGQTVQSGEFGAPTLVCLPDGEGRLIFLDATTSPRAQSELSVFYSNGNTCGFISNAGTLVLIP